MMPSPVASTSEERRPSSAGPRVMSVVVHYRDLAQTQACLEALQALRGASTEILVVDNSPASEALAAFAHTDTAVISAGRNLGFAGGCNLAFEDLRARAADYLWLVNSDARVDPDALKALLDTAEANPTAGAIGCVLRDPRFPDRTEAFGGGCVSWWTGHIRHIRHNRQRLDYLTGASLLLRRTALEAIGPLDEAFFFLGEDVDLCLRLRHAGWDIGVADQALVWHGGAGREPEASPFRTEWHTAAVVRLLRKHGRAAIVTTLPILGYALCRAAALRSPTLVTAAWRGWRRGWQTPVGT
ncbi:MAG TPA: glycosyltransferase family 2 protein [Planctomycetaceae bacterium]|nr:glycosyltransferase family 2 protein [Planctomycetaceae bacterium]